jgi:hypothetical protein
MKSLLKLSGIILVLATLFACTKNDETGISLKVIGTYTPESLSMATAMDSPAKSSELSSQGTGIAAEGFTFTEALLGIREIEIEGEEEHETEEPDDESEAENEFEFEGNYLIDLLTGTSTPELGFENFIPGIYTNFEAETAGIIDGNKTVSMKGTYTDAGSNNYKFEFSTTAEIEFEYETETGFELTEGTILELVVKINLPAIFEGVDFSSATVNADNVIIINESTNIEILNIIKSNVRNMAEMEEDDDDGDDHDD